MHQLKEHLHMLLGVPQDQQRIVHGNVILHDGSELDSSTDVQLVVLLPFRNASREDATKFIRAVDRNDVDVVDKLLQSRHDPNCAAWVRNEHLTPILAAVKKGHREIVSLLLEAGARDVDRAALEAAVTAGHLGSFRLLLEAGGGAGCALQDACRHGRVEIVRMWSERPDAFYIPARVYRETLVDVSMAAVASTENYFRILLFLLEGGRLGGFPSAVLASVVAACKVDFRELPISFCCIAVISVAVCIVFRLPVLFCLVSPTIFGMCVRSFRVVLVLLLSVLREF
ncbi:Ankrd17 [Symbiodinium sp. CCMP2592]|nr:Ankrd17 [Symbiodinium sp. CCMP2592]